MSDQPASPTPPDPPLLPPDGIALPRLAPAPDPTATTCPPPLAAPVEEAPESHPFIFHGRTDEYFRIWIVNTLLTLLTVGLYSAWAKVRKRRYLRGSTELMGHRFDYLAEPGRILAGNLLVALMFLAYMVVGEVYPAVRVGAIVAGLALLPWVIMRSLAFNAHNTAYRGLRFFARRTYGYTMLVYIGQWFFIIFSLGLYYPAWVRNRKEFVISSHRLGDAFFRFQSKSGPFYSAYFFSGLVIVAGSVTGGVLTAMVTQQRGGHQPTFTELIPFFILYAFALYLAKHYTYARLFNHIWASTQLDEHRFRADLPVGAWLRLQLGNLAAIIGTCGLLYPWAVVRSTRFALAHLAFLPAAPLEKISRLGRHDGSAVGETAAEFVGLDIGL